MKLNSLGSKIGLLGVGLAAGFIVAGTMAAQAATPTPSSTSSSTGSTATDTHPGDNGADGVPEAQERHGGGGLNLSGTVTAVGTGTVTIKTSSGTRLYSVTANSDIDKNGEARLSALAAGDAVRFSVASTNARQIDKLHAGDEAKDMPQGGPPSGATPGSTSSNGA